MLFVNFKTYKEATGERAASLARILSSCGEKANVPTISVVQACDIYLCARASAGAVWAQHVDELPYGQYTGWVLPEAVLGAGAKGTFLNHSEHPFPLEYLEKAIGRCREVGLETMVFAGNLEALREVSALSPDMVCYEPPELIASKTTSVAQAESEIIKKAVAIAGSIPLVVGAGVKSREDVEVSLKLGAAGVAVSSAVVLAEDPRLVLQEMVEGFK